MNLGVEPVVSLDTDPDVGVGVLGRALVGGDHANAHVTLPRLEGGGIDLSSSFGTVSTVPSSGCVKHFCTGIKELKVPNPVTIRRHRAAGMTPSIVDSCKSPYNAGEVPT